MIDLQKNKQRYEIKMFDGEVIHVLYPSQGILYRLIALKDDIAAQKLKDLAILENIYELLGVILSRNDEKREITKEYLENNLDMANAIYVLNDYFNVIADNLKKL